MKHDYSKLDAAILSRIKETAPVTFESLRHGNVEQEADLLSINDEADGWRIVDRRLQSLRKSGAIRYQRSPNEGWVLCQAVASEQ